ncbi:MAG: hypothetical protein HOL28_05230 [Crocinitomicaceae bacterium]|jgi:hypothetical protein|nr:hypothetical protein [Crocinitomicaceae bacterium]MBT6515040.1 hypothetical protein [Crocinitomicaceae bacterium]
MKLKEIKLSFKLVSILSEINAFWMLLKGFSWTKEEVNALLLKRSAQLFDIKIIDVEGSRFTLSNRRKARFMRSLKNNLPKNDRKYLTKIFMLFKRTKRKKSMDKRIQKFASESNPFHKNVYHKIE